MIHQRKRFNKLLKGAQHHAILQRAVHADVHHFHGRILAILHQGGLRCRTADVPRKEQDTHHRCIICGRNWNTYIRHSFKSHDRLSAYRQLQLGTRCESCGRTFSNNARLTRHFRSVQGCADTLAAQRRWETPQSSVGHRQITDALPYDSMIPSYDGEGPTLPQRHGWTMTNASLKALKAFTKIDWTNVNQKEKDDLTKYLCQLPLHKKEFHPPSIWRVPVMQLLRRHWNVGMVHLKQGCYGRPSPKPTALWLICPPSVRSRMVRTLQETSRG